MGTCDWSPRALYPSLQKTLALEAFGPGSRPRPTPSLLCDLSRALHLSGPQFSQPQYETNSSSPLGLVDGRSKVNEGTFLQS